MLRFGLFGAGRIGRVHAASLAMHPRTELVLVHDPVEAAALGGVLGATRGAADPLPVGSAKTNVGHLEGAAGIGYVLRGGFEMRDLADSLALVEDVD